MIVCDQDGNKLMDELNNHQGAKQRSEGKPTSLKDTENVNNEGPAVEPPVYTPGDGDGNAYPSQLPMHRVKIVRQPNLIVYFFDWLNRYCGGKGLTVVNEYKEYERKFNENLERAQGKTPTIDYNAAAGVIWQQAQPDSAVQAVQVEQPAIEGTAERSRRIAEQFCNDPDQITAVDKKWASENRDALRNAFQQMKDEYISQQSEPYSENVQKKINMFDTNLASFDRPVEAPAEPGKKQLDNTVERQRDKVIEPIQRQPGLH